MSRPSRHGYRKFSRVHSAASRQPLGKLLRRKAELHRERSPHVGDRAPVPGGGLLEQWTHKRLEVGNGHLGAPTLRRATSTICAYGSARSRCASWRGGGLGG